jgi:hypothetical protein
MSPKKTQSEREKSKGKNEVNPKPEQHLYGSLT